MWFSEIASVSNPGREQLSQFISGVEQFLAFVIENSNDFAFLWEDAPELQGLAQDTFNQDVRRGANDLRRAIPEISERVLAVHGLVGKPMRFKLKVVDSIGRRWEQVRGQFSIREWLKQIFDAIDAILDSVIHAAGGVGGLIMEFKEALSALVKTR